MWLPQREEKRTNTSSLEDALKKAPLQGRSYYAVLVEAAFINNDSDNALFDQRFNDIAKAIADGILESI